MAKISFNPSTVAALTLPPNNKDITFDLRGHNIFARGVEFKGTDTNTWRSVTINGTSLGTKTLELKNGSNISITANGTISASGLASSSHTHPLIINGKSFSLGTTSLNLGTYVPWTSNGYTLNISTKSGNDVDTGGGLYIDAYTGTLFYLWLHDTSNVWYKKTSSGSWKKMDAGNADTWGGYSAKLTTENTSGTKILVVDGTNVQYRTLSSILAGHNTWRNILINGTNIGTNVLNLKNGSNIILSNTNGQVTISASGLASSDHSHDDRYLKLAGGTMVGDIYFSGDNKICWSRNTDSASISFKNTKDGDTDSYMSFVTSDNGNEYFRWSHTSGTNIEWMSLKADGLRIKGTKVSLENHLHIVTINGTTKTISNSTIDLGYYLPQNGQIAGWGTLTNANGYSAITHFDLGAKGAFALAGKNNQMFMLLDGTIYVNEGSQEVATKLWVENKGYVTGSVVGRTITINGTSTTWQNTWRDIKINNSSISNNTLNIIQGDNITISNSNGTARISTTGLASSNHTHSFITTIGKTTIDSTSYTANRFNTIFYYNSNGPTTYGNILSVVDLYNGGGLLALPWSGSQTKADGTDTAVERLKYRSKRDCVGGWTIWKTIPYMDDLTWDNITNKPSTFTPSQHSHTWQSITDKLTSNNEFNIVNSGYNNTLWFNYLPIDDRSKSATVALYIFGNGNKGYSSLLASGYVKNGSDDNYVLLGGGGHKALSDLSNSHNHDGRYHLNHVALWDFTLKHNRAYVTFDLSGTSLGWVNGFVSTHNDYLSSYIVNTHRTANWYVGYSENESTTEPTWYKLIHSGNYTEFAAKADHTHSQYIKRTGDTMSGALNFANGTWNLVGDDSYMGDCNIAGHFGIKAANTTYPGIAFYNNDNTLLGKLTAYSGNIKYGSYSLQFLDNGNTTVTSSIWTNPFDTYNANAVADNLAICVWGQASKLTNLSSDTGDMSLWLRRISASLATLNMVLDGEYYANGNLRLAHVSELSNITVTLHTSNDTNYPLVWSNLCNANSVTENLLHKSWSDLYYNPKYKRLTVGGLIVSNYLSGTWVSSLTNAALTIPLHTSYGGIFCAPTKEGNIVVSTYAYNDNNLYFGYGEKGRLENSFKQQIYWDAANNNFHMGHITMNGSITNLAIGGGLYWNPYVESNIDATDAASITLTKSGIAGGTTLVITLQNDASDTILFVTNTSSRLYHNSYPILTTQNTYVSNGTGVINNATITLVSNADTVDGFHYNSFAPYNGNKFGHGPDSNIWHKILEFKTNWVGEVTFMYSPEECLRDYWAIYNVNLRSDDIWFRGFSFSSYPSIKCVGPGYLNGNWSIWVKGSTNTYDPYGVIQVLNISNASIVSVGLSLSQTTEPSSTYSKTPTMSIAGVVDWSNITNKPFKWEGKSGLPSWVWGSNDGINYYVWNPSNFSVNYASSAGDSDTVDGYHATDGRTFTSRISFGSWEDTWSDGTNTHPWYGYDMTHHNTGAYSTTISDYFGMTIKTANTLRLDCNKLLINGTNITDLNVASATKLLTARNIWGLSFDGTKDITGTLHLSYNTMGINFRGIGLNNSWSSWASHQTAGNEALVFGTQSVNTAFMVINGESYANISSSRYQSLSPGLLVQNNCVTIGYKYGSIDSTYRLKVNGNTYVSGVLQATNEIRSSSANAFRLNYGSYGVFHRNDGADYYILLTNLNDINGAWNDYRPFRINLASGTAYLNGWSTNANVAERLLTSQITDLNEPSYWNTNYIGLVFDDFNNSASNKPQSVDNANAVITLLKSKHGTDGLYCNLLAFADNREIYTRQSVAGKWGNWVKLITSENITNYYWANVKISSTSNSLTLPSVNTIYASNWFRSTGQTGWYSQTYGGGWYMSDTTCIRAFNNKSIYSTGYLHIGTIKSTGTDLNIYSDTLFHLKTNNFVGVLPRVVCAFSFRFTKGQTSTTANMIYTGNSSGVVVHRLDVGRYYSRITMSKRPGNSNIFGIAILNNNSKITDSEHMTLKATIAKLGIYENEILIRIIVSDDESENDIFDTAFTLTYPYSIHCWILQI